MKRLGISFRECPFGVFMKNTKKRRNYMFTNRKHPDGAIMSVLLGIISLAGTVIAVCLAYRQAHEGMIGYGVTGLLATLFALAGLVLAVMQIIKKDVFKLFPVIGLVLNLVVLMGMGLMIFWGMA